MNHSVIYLRRPY
ncbi:hypothetical protein D030_0906A, partial [Vibrio parahaemolyticus AQ3810]